VLAGPRRHPGAAFATVVAVAFLAVPVAFWLFLRSTTSDPDPALASAQAMAHRLLRGTESIDTESHGAGRYVFRVVYQSSDGNVGTTMLATHIGVAVCMRGERAVDAILGDVVIARDLECHERRAAVLGDVALVALGERRLDLVDALRVLEARDDILDGGRELRITDLHGALALHEHLLLRGVAEIGLRDGLVGDLGRAVAVVLVCDGLLADGSRQEHRDHDERQPAEDRGLAMSGAPPRGAGGEVLGLHWGSPPMKLRESDTGRFGLRTPRSMGEDWCPAVRTTSPASVRPVRTRIPLI
jgi:hypothetical protein